MPSDGDNMCLHQVCKEAAKVGGSAVLIWVNGVLDPKDQKVVSAVKKTPDPSDKQTNNNLMPEGMYAHVGTSQPYETSEGWERASACAVLMQRTTGTQLCSSLLNAVAPTMHAITAQHLLGRASEKADAARKAAADGRQAPAADGPSTAREAPQKVLECRV